MRNDDNQQAQGGPEAELEARRRALSGKLDNVKGPELQSAISGEVSREAMGLGQAMKLSSEFAAGVIAGSALGWLIDRFAGSSPWGLIVCTLLGFAAGIMNMMRASGLLPNWGRK